jgi:hypothetical protein
MIQYGIRERRAVSSRARLGAQRVGCWSLSLSPLGFAFIVGVAAFLLASHVTDFGFGFLVGMVAFVLAYPGTKTIHLMVR